MDIFAERDILENLNLECPVIVNIITEIKSHERKMFMPKEVVDILNVVLDKHEMISKLAEKEKVKRINLQEQSPPQTAILHFLSNLRTKESVIEEIILNSCILQI